MRAETLVPGVAGPSDAAPRSASGAQVRRLLACPAVPVRAVLSVAMASPRSAGKRIGPGGRRCGGGRIGSIGGIGSRGATVGDEDLGPCRAQTGPDRHRCGGIGRHDRADHDGSCVRPFDGHDPVRKRKIRAEVDHRQPGPTQRRREDEPTELVTGPGRHPDEHGSALVTTRPGCLEPGRETTKDRVARDVLARDGNAARRPGVAEGTERRDHVVVHDSLVGPAGEHLVQDRLDPRAVEARGGVDELLHERMRPSFGRGISIGMLAGGSVPAMIAAAAALGDQPSSINRRIDHSRPIAASS